MQKQAFHIDLVVPRGRGVIVTISTWVGNHPRLRIHFTSNFVSWLDMVERFFRGISTDRIERGVYKSVPELITAMEERITVHN